ncbi:hypothetical protein Tco_1078300 [Tanacetum coccineum]
MKPPTTNEQIINEEFPSSTEEVFHEASQSLSKEYSSSLSPSEVQQSYEDVTILLQSTQFVTNEIFPNESEENSSPIIFNKQLEDAYFDANATFQDPSNIHTFYKPYLE